MSDAQNFSDLVKQTTALLRYQQELGLTSVPYAPAAPETVPACDTHVPQSLADIRADLGDCTRCKLCKGRTHIVFGVGDANARLMFIGEGPGRDEDLQGEPFVGEAGKLLDRMLKAMGLSRQRVYIANIVKCRPPRNRDPEPDEVLACSPFIREQVRSVNPDVIVTLGRVATQSLLLEKLSITRIRGQWQTYENRPVMPTFHPAYLLRNPADKKLVWLDLQHVMQRLELPLPNAATGNSP